MGAARGLLVFLAAAAVGVAYYSGRDETGDPGRQAAVRPDPDAVRLTFSYSTNLEEMMATLLPRFNGERVRVGGRPVFVTGVPASSGDAQTKIMRGTLKPHVWAPASSLWGRLLNHETDRPYIADENPSLASSPVVIAMWEPLARALGWPRKAIGFADILELATTKSSWAEYGKPTYGEFKLGHTNPDFSTSGLSFVAAQYYAASGKREGLTVEDVENPAIRGRVRAIEQSIVHYGDTGSFFSEQLAEHGPGYASAVAMEETTLLEFNEQRKPGELRLVAIYPAEGTYVSDNPYMALDAPWVTPLQKQAAARLGTWLRGQLTTEVVARFRYRPGDDDVRPLAPVTRANGADPDQPRRVLSLPQPDVLARIKDAWREDRKPANVMLVVDVSGSMNDENKIGQAREGLKTFLGQLSDRDRVGLMTFESGITPIVPVGPFATMRPLLELRASELIANGGTRLYDATDAGWRAVDALADDERINAVVILSDGADTESGLDQESLLAGIRARAEGDGRQIRIFTIAYGSDAEREVLDEIAHASGGKGYAGSPETIETVYLQISSYF
jgi:Ca-activated chloride channel family protein